jgi:hypothetical protein
MRKSILLFFILVLIMTGQLGAQTVTKFAGTAQVFGTDPVSGGILKDAVHFNQPYGIAIDNKDNIWISDKTNHRIRMLQKSDQKIYTRAGYDFGYKDATGITSQFDNPMGIAVNLTTNEIFVCDNGNFCIRKISAFGNVGSAQTVTTFAGKISGGYTQQGYADGAGSVAMFSSPTDIAIDASGNLFIADAGNNAIRKITTAGVVSTIAGGPTIPGYVDGTLAQAKFSSPAGIFVTSSGDIYVADKGNSKIRKISGGTVTTVPVTGLWSPDDVVVTSNGTLYISDQHKIVKYSGSSSIVFAGSVVLNQSGYLNGEGTLARFNNVKTMVLRSSDNCLYVADNDNHVIRQVTVSTTSNPPKCAFTANKTTVGKNGVVTFTDQSTYSPTSRKWTFTGGSPATLTSSATALVTYSTSGTYSVKLVVSNVDGKDSLTKTNYITVTTVNGIDDNSVSPIKVYPSPASDMIYLNTGDIDMGNATLMIASINGKFNMIVENHFIKDDVVQIPVNELLPGIYLLLVKTTKDVYRFRFVKQ